MRYTPVIENRTEQGLYQEEMEIKFCQCDASHRLKLSELFRILTDMADSAFAFRGMDHQFLMENRMVFLITRFSVLVNRMPVQTERVRVATWEQQIERAQFIRNFCVWDKDGNTLIEVSSGWILVDPVDRSILRPVQFEERFPGSLRPAPLEKSGAPDFVRLRLRETDEGALRGDDRKIVYSDIDGNGHVDNARYVDMAMDILPERLSCLSPKYVQVAFNREAMLGESLQMFWKEDEGKVTVKGMAEGKDSFICMIDFEQLK